MGRITLNSTEDVFNKCFKVPKKQNVKYILKDSLNTHISMHNTEDEVFDKLHEFSKKFKDSFSTFGASFDFDTGEAKPTYEDNAVFTIPEEMQQGYGGEKYIKFYFFKFDLNENKIISLYK